MGTQHALIISRAPGNQINHSDKKHGQDRIYHQPCNCDFGVSTFHQTSCDTLTNGNKPLAPSTQGQILGSTTLCTIQRFNTTSNPSHSGIVIFCTTINKHRRTRKCGAHFDHVNGSPSYRKEFSGRKQERSDGD